MSEQLNRNLSLLRQTPEIGCLNELVHGVEKESLRVDASGHMAATPHPEGAGSALTHPCITTDFSEALMEFITPVFTKPGESIACLSDIHTFTYTQMEREELLWTSSMPCIVGKDEEIPLAQYGSSNTGKLKTLYRKGLGFRYGRTMQTIAGIHFNFSLPDSFWPMYHQLLGSEQTLQDFKTEQYFGLIRNFRRYSWLLIYLYGASPALCKSFVRNNSKHGLEDFDEHTLYAPYATSLRMGDLGYTSKAQSELYICYNSLEEYAKGLLAAIKTPYPPYSQFKTADGSPAQLNDSILQIENEFYSTIRPKRVSKSGQRPVVVLREEGVEYIEVRCLDLNPFLPVGIDEEQINFLNAFLLVCLLRTSPASTRDEYHEIQDNVQSVVKAGRDPALQLMVAGKEVNMKDWATEILKDVTEIATLLDKLGETDVHSKATANQQAKVVDPALTPSAKVLRRMREMKTPYFRFAMNQSLANSDYFRGLKLSEDKMAEFSAMTIDSKRAQLDIEANDDMDFESFLQVRNNS